MVSNPNISLTVDQTQRDPWRFRLFVARNARNSLLAVRHLRQICEEYLAGSYEIEVIDLLDNPDAAGEEQIVAVPTLVRKQPFPMRKIIGDFSRRERLLAALDLPRMRG